MGHSHLLTWNVLHGARSRNRTGMGFPPTDFKSVASTYSAIRAATNSGAHYAIALEKSVMFYRLIHHALFMYEAEKSV